MRQEGQRTNWFIDAVLFGGFLSALWLDLTGVAVHQWLGLAVSALAGYHLWQHRRWVEAVTTRLFGRTSQQSRTFYAVDAGVAAGFAAITITGLGISTWLDLSLASYAAWRAAHVVASVGTLTLAVVKIGLHWRWIVGVVRRSVFPVCTAAPTGQVGAPQPGSATARVPLGRRDFVRLMAGVGAVALLTGVNALAGSAGDQAETVGVTQDTDTTLTWSTTSSARTSSSCTVRCGKRCSYPGHCRKYVDTNGNGRCDWGECLS